MDTCVKTIESDVADKTVTFVKKSEFISVVAYIHNNSNKIHNFIETVMSRCHSEFKHCEIIFVDDYSTDDSVAVIKDYYKKNPVDYMVSIIKMGYYHGMESSMNAGRDMAIGDYVYEFDDIYIDYDSEVVISAYEKCLEGYDIVVVSTDVPIRLTSKIFYSVFNKAILSNNHIGQDSFRIISRRGINRVTSMDVDILYRKAVYLNCGLRTAGIEYKSTTGVRPPRITQKYERIDLAMDSFVYFTNVAERVVIGMVAFFAVLLIFAIGYAIISRVMGYHNGLGWLSMMLVLSSGFMGLFGILAIAIKYLSVIVKLLFKSQKQFISEIDKISSR